MAIDDDLHMSKHIIVMTFFELSTLKEILVLLTMNMFLFCCSIENRNINEILGNENYLSRTFPLGFSQRLQTRFRMNSLWFRNCYKIKMHSKIILMSRCTRSRFWWSNNGFIQNVLILWKSPLCACIFEDSMIDNLSV